jgi:hypothetical protein
VMASGERLVCPLPLVGLLYSIGNHTHFREGMNA